MAQATSTLDSGATTNPQQSRSRGSDDPPGDDRGGDRPEGSSDDPPGDDKGGQRPDGVSDDPPGDDRSGRDTFRGSGSDDAFDGRGGIDTVMFGLSRSAYALQRSESGVLIVVGEGTDALSNIERLVFADDKLAFDLDGSAGKTAKLLGALFGAECVNDKAYVAAGIALFDGGTTYEAGAALAMQTVAFQQLLGTNTDDSFVRLLYANVAGTGPTSDKVIYFTGLLESGLQTRASLAVMAAECDLNQLRIDFVGLSQRGLEFS